jgi:hypothetical protein
MGEYQRLSGRYRNAVSEAAAQPAITPSDRRHGTYCASCAFRAGERLHDPVHENDKSERCYIRNH